MGVMALMAEMAKAPSRRPVCLGAYSRHEVRPSRPRVVTGRVRWLGAGGALLLALSAQGANWNTSAGLQVSETWSDNIALAAAGSERHEMVTDVSPSVHLSSTGGRLGLNLDASCHGLQYANGTSAKHSDTTLNSTGKLEVIDKWLFVDGIASISQQNTSPFAGQNTSLANIDSNRSTVRNFSLTPNIQGMLGADLSYSLRYLNSQTSTDSTLASNSRGRTFSGGLKWGNSSRLFNFGADFSSASTAYANQADTTTRSVRATAYLNADAHLNFSAFVSRESNNYSLTGQSGVAKGINMHWTVSERTSLDLAREYHVYGPTAQVSFSHRMPRSAFQLSYSRSSNTTSTQGITTGFSPTYNTFLQQCLPFLPVEQCSPLAVQLLGTSAFAQLPFISNTSYIQRSLQGSLVLTGVRNTVSLTASRSDSRNDSAIAAASDILASSSLILQRSFSLNWAFKLTPFSNLTSSVSRSRNSSPGVAASDTTYTALNLLWSTQLTQKLLGSLSLRHTLNAVTAGTVLPYREHAAIATLGYTY